MNGQIDWFKCKCGRITNRPIGDGCYLCDKSRKALYCGIDRNRAGVKSELEVSNSSDNDVTGTC